MRAGRIFWILYNSFMDWTYIIIASSLLVSVIVFAVTFWVLRKKIRDRRM